MRPPHTNPGPGPPSMQVGVQRSPRDIYPTRPSGSRQGHRGAAPSRTRPEEVTAVDEPLIPGWPRRDSRSLPLPRTADTAGHLLQGAFGTRPSLQPGPLPGGLVRGAPRSLHPNCFIKGARDASVPSPDETRVLDPSDHQPDAQQGSATTRSRRPGQAPGWVSLWPRVPGQEPAQAQGQPGTRRGLGVSWGTLPRPLPPTPGRWPPGFHSLGT